MTSSVKAPIRTLTQFEMSNIVAFRSGLEPFRKSVLLLLLPWCGAQAAIAVWCFAIGDYAVLRQVGLDVLRDLGSNFDEASPPFPSVFGVVSRIRNDRS